MSTEPIVFTLEKTTGAPGSLPVVLKKIMEIPPPNLLEGDDETDKEKLCLGEDVDLGVGGSGIGIGPSAALTPAIWEKTIPYDGENFHLEYMDLEEFLMENGISASADEDLLKSDHEGDTQKTEEKPKATQATKATKAAKTTALPVALLPILELDQCEEEVVTITMSQSDISSDVTTVTIDKDRVTPEISPEEIEVDVKFEPDPTDLVLSSVPGGELFNPRKHKFTDEELKPQPMIKKAKKVFVPEEQKDDKYWQRRKKNNVAAKRSRDARRLKENQITVRAAFLERENTALRTEVADLRKECGRFKNVVASYVAKFGQLALPEEQ
ncbi:TEF transcription factor, PAR bZIP family member a isoform X2 [Centroberyx affinis]|uniref:TEF transcription factor, PAR bZIP family member a isoform X2 n=1 Tax=Centroberyx affinis TaxID=166261 RepID=UPI003A5BEC91